MTWCREVARVSCLRCGLHLQSACSGWIAFSPLPVTMLITSSLVSRVVDCFVSFPSLPVLRALADLRVCSMRSASASDYRTLSAWRLRWASGGLGVLDRGSAGSHHLVGFGPWRSSRAAWYASGQLVLMSNPGAYNLCSIACARACACCFL